MHLSMLTNVPHVIMNYTRMCIFFLNPKKYFSFIYDSICTLLQSAAIIRFSEVVYVIISIAMNFRKIQRSY